MTPSLSGKKSRLKLKFSKKPNLKLKPSKIKTKKIKVDHDKANNAVRHSDSVNCVFCSKFRACDNINKKMSFVCNKFTRFDTKDNEIKPKKKPSTTIIIRDDERSERLSYEKMMDDFEKHSNMSPLPPDLKVDDRDIPQAKNFIEWTTGKRFLNITPFAKQIQVGLHAFAEWCPNPKCTDENYIFDIPKKHTVDQILERVTPLEWGVCPRCKYRKSQMFADGVKIPNELDLLVGQRCITGNSLVVTSSGLLPIKQLKSTAIEGFSNYGKNPNVVLDNGAVVQPTKFFIQHDQKVHKVKLHNGYTITGTPEHPLLTDQGFRKIADIQIGTAIPLVIGQNVWGTKILNVGKQINPIWQKTIKLGKFKKFKHFEPYDRLLTARLYRLLGYWVAEGSGGKVHISNQDKNILRDCSKGLGQLYGKQHVTKYRNGVQVHGKNALSHFNLLLGNGGEHRSAKKEIPQHVMSAPKKMVQQFMRALFEGDAGFNGKAIEYCTISRKLCQQISAVLHNFGVVHLIRQGETWASNGTVKQVIKKKYSLFIEGIEGLIQFKKHIGFISLRKQERLDITVEALQNQPIQMPYWYDKFPESIKQEYFTLIEEIGSSLNQYRFWNKTRGCYLSCNYGVTSLFDRNHTFWRLKADNVALSKQRIRSNLVDLYANPNWRLVSLELKNKLSAFINKYLAANTYWTSVVKNKSLKKLQTVYDLHVPIHHRFIANGLINHNSGKSAVTVMIASYTLHGFLKLQNAPQAFNLLANETLEGTLVALTATKARDLIYSKLEGYLKDTPWFKQYHGMLDEYGKKYGEELYRVRDMFASYRCRSLIIKAVDPDMRKLRGATRFFGAIDELGWFLSSEKGNAIKFDAKEIVKSMDNQFLTVREGYYDLLKQGMDGIITPMLCYISSPSSKKDLMVKAYLNSLDSETAVGFNYATWEFHPRMSKNTKAIAKKFKEDPIEAMRDFGAVPPNSSAPFISDIDHVKRIVEKNRFNTVRCTSKDITAPGGKIMRTGDLRIIAPKDNNKRIIALDSASVNNSFAIVLGYFDDVLHRPIFDTFVEIQNTKESELNYNAVFNDVISPLCEHFNVGIIVADRFQSNKFIHDIQEEYQIPGEIYSVKYKDFTDFKQDILNSNITIPKPEMTPKEIEETGGDNYPHNFRKAPVAHFLYQLITVQDMKKEVLKGEGLTDDLFRACVLAYSYLVDPQYREHCSGKSQTAIIKPAYISGILTSRGNARGTNASRAGTTSNGEVFVAIASRGR